jgi:diphthamide synthase (EF-2-diphthine--ammonia ligase)
MTVLVIAREQAVLDRVLPLLRQGGIEAASTTSDEEAVRQLEAGGVAAVVIGGGVQEPSRQHLRSVANRKGIRVIDGALRGKDPEVYVRDELLPALQRAIE